MDKIKTLFKNKKILISVIAVLVIIGSIGGYFVYDTNRKNTIGDKMTITFTDVKAVEYGTKDYDVKKELVKEVKDAELTDVPKIDTMKIGEITLTFNLKKDDVTKEVEHTIKIVDTKGPEISLETDSKELTVGDEYDIKSNITSVKDPVDGAVELNDKSLEVNKEATEEYLKLKKEEITDETKIADYKLSDFLIETTKDEDEKEVTNLYLKNCYYIDGSVDTSKSGENKITVTAIDKNGLKTVKEFTVTVKEKEVEQPTTSVGGGSYTSNGGGYSSGGSSNNGGSSSYVGSKQDIVNTALAQVGKSYQLGASGPNAFDCSGLIYYAYSQNGWSIPRYPESGGTRISFNDIQIGDILYMPNGGSGTPHVALYIGNNQFVEAKNPSQGVGYFMMYYGVQPDWQFIRY